MEKLERYLDQVCQSIGGPIEMRQHVRQELREHLLDAVAQHKAAGLSEADAVTKALEEFGNPEDVRTELEATHGKRMTWIIDKAMQWKERTMKAKWLWMTWAHLGVGLVVAMQVLFITFNVVFIIPKFQKLMADGIIDPAVLDDQELAWMVNYLLTLREVFGKFATFMLVGAIVAVGLFEWRVKSEHKPFIRLSALGSLAVILMVLIALMAGSLVILFCIGVPAVNRISRPFALEQVAIVEKSLTALDDAAAKKDWKAMQEPADQTVKALNLLLAGPVLPSLSARYEAPSANELRGHVKVATTHLQAARDAIAAEDQVRLRTALAELRKSFDPVREAAKRQPK